MAIVHWRVGTLLMEDCELFTRGSEELKKGAHELRSARVSCSSTACATESCKGMPPACCVVLQRQ